MSRNSSSGVTFSEKPKRSNTPDAKRVGCVVKKGSCDWKEGVEQSTLSFMKEVPFSGADAQKASEDFSNRKNAGESRLRSVRTYRADVQELISKKKVTRTHVAIAEEERRRAIGESSVWEEQKTTSVLPLLIAGVFLLTGTGILFYDLAGQYFPALQRSIPTQPFVVPGEKSGVVGLSLYTREELVRGIQSVARKEKLAQGEHLRLSFRAQKDTASLPVPIKTFLLTLEGNIPDAFSRSLSSAYEGGLLSAGEMKGYLLFSTTYYENSVVGLLSWEKTLMRDLYPVIDPLRAELIPTPADGEWRSQSWNGYDLRVFTSNDGRVALVYGWIDKKNLIMTGSIQVFSELTRLVNNPPKA